MDPLVKCQREEADVVLLSLALQECVDIDECLELAGACVANSVCVNTVVRSLRFS